MAESKAGQILNPDELYAQGMAHYRQRRWQEAKVCFEQVKVLQPNYRGIDVLLRELDIFLQLESVESRTLPAEPDIQTEPRPQSLARQASTSSVAKPREEPLSIEPELLPQVSAGPSWWIWPLVLLGAAALIAMAYMVLMDPLGLFQSNERLQVRCQSMVIAQRWCEALGVCSQWAAV
ncbi:MAG: tetratricopeptide repeat protein, partial [Chloroflexi bacterium]|nr:tetratricopeptide repeat protein [Chloroflexota bacterium]